MARRRLIRIALAATAGVGVLFGVGYAATGRAHGPAPRSSIQGHDDGEHGMAARFAPPAKFGADRATAAAVTHVAGTALKIGRDSEHGNIA